MISALTPPIPALNPNYSFNFLCSPVISLFFLPQLIKIKFLYSQIDTIKLQTEAKVHLKPLLNYLNTGKNYFQLCPLVINTPNTNTASMGSDNLSSNG